MNKPQLIEQIAKHGGMVTFEAVEKPERQGRNPQTGEAVTIPARKAVKFKAAKALKEAVNA